MKPEEAIARIERMADDYDFYIVEQDALDTALEALAKQIPKPVEYVNDYTWSIGNEQPICPECEGYASPIVFIPFDGQENAPKISYCEFCGQAISWED